MDEAESIQLTSPSGHPIPVFVKISPDMADQDMVNLIEVAIDQRLAGIIATNTTVARPGIASVQHSEQEGGMSGSRCASEPTR